ncbi:unnamed protein product [Taenia asiatica]|uniref:Secreted protein n=1 Tax=Taenia asiatica TaxID=60517 RepID=A0A0R3WD37_TAEAS|nr:unnamed protein product [Taenia asiatica]
MGRVIKAGFKKALNFLSVELRSVTIVTVIVTNLPWIKVANRGFGFCEAATLVVDYRSASEPTADAMNRKRPRKN